MSAPHPHAAATPEGGSPSGAAPGDGGDGGPGGGLAPPGAGPPGLHLDRKVLAMLLGFLLTTLGATALVRHLDFELLEPYFNPTLAEAVSAWRGKGWQEDVLFLGTSRFDVGLDGRILQEELERALPGESVRSYKLAVGGLQMQYMVSLLEDAIAQRPPLRLLVLDIDARSFVEEDRASLAAGRLRQPFELETFVPLDPLRRRPGVSPDQWLLGALQHLADRCTGTLSGLKKIWNLYWLALPKTRQALAFQAQNLGERRTPEEAWEHDRFLEQVLQQQGGKDAVVELAEGTDWVWHRPSDPDLVAFRRLLEILDDLPCEVVFVRPPAEDGYFAAHMRGPNEKFERQVLPVILAHGYDYYDLNRPPYRREERYFRASHHMNRLGCENWSRVIVHDLLVPLWRGQQPPGALPQDLSREGG